MNEIAKKEQNTQIQSNVTTPVHLLNMAVQQGADIDKLEKLMDLQTRWEQNEARKAYHQAIAEFKTESINIIKNKSVSFDNSNGGKTEYKHATLSNILELTVPVLAKYGLSHSWSTEQADGLVTVKCFLTHSAGHSESVSLFSSPDTSGKKNGIQQIGSTISYLERYTFLAITGLAAKDQDDDGSSSGEREGFAEGLAYGMACYNLKESIEAIKKGIAENDYDSACEAFYELNRDELQSLKRAPTKGGIFTTEERKVFQSSEWIAARKRFFS